MAVATFRSARSKSNKVDKLLAQVARIQENCEHRFSVGKASKLPESKVKGVYIAYDASRRSSCMPTTTFRCAGCSKEKEVSVAEVCPRCLGKMRELSGLDVREKYFGIDYIYYAARLHRCDCGFTVVVDEWDR